MAKINENLKGKKLLIISSEKKDESFVNAAKEMGIYTICCDRYTDYNISQAKIISDEAWDIDYNNTEEIVEKCKINGINGIIAGYNEDRVLAAAKIAKALNLPFYASIDQINITRNKNNFKKICKESGIKTPKTYNIDTLPSTFDLPVIIKPSDGCGRKGITIITDIQELEEAIKYAKENSKDNEIVIEEYIQGSELIAIYTLKEGEYSLSCLNDKYLSEDPEGKTLCDLVISPSKYLDRFVMEIDPGIRKFLKSIKARNGVANFQFIANESGIYAFEMGYRTNGNDDWKAIDKYNNINFIKMLIQHSLTGEMGSDLAKDNPRFPEYAVTLCGYSKPGKIKTINKEGLKNISNIYNILFTKKEGNIIPSVQSNARKLFLIKFTDKTLREVANTIKNIQDNIIIKDEAGLDMVLKKFDTHRLFN